MVVVPLLECLKGALGVIAQARHAVYALDIIEVHNQVPPQYDAHR